MFVIFLALLALFVVLAFENDSSMNMEQVSPEIKNEIQKLTHYAEEYETGNINYVQLLVYMSSIRENLNEILGVVSREHGGILKQEQLKAVLGEADEMTKWLWVENEKREKKLDKEVPAWKKIIFDGKKIQMKLNAYPFMFTEKEKFLGDEEKEKPGKNKEDFFEEYKNLVLYNLHFSVDFKKPEEQLDIQGKIDEINNIAKNYNSNPTQENAELLARESVNAEKIFESYFRQNQKNCEAVMTGIFGAENKREEQKLLVQEISFFSGEDFEVQGRLEFCEECEWSWINFDFWVNGRGPGFKMPEMKEEMPNPENFKKMDFSQFESSFRNEVEKLRELLEKGDLEGALSLKGNINVMNQAWNEKANDVWKEIEKIFEEKRKLMSEKEMEEFNRNYGWLKEEQEKRKKVKELQKENFEKRKRFYLELFSGYEKKEFYFTQIEFEKRLVEEFREFGKEICDNNKDDNENEKVDCDDEQCGGKKCGEEKIKIEEGNETKEEIKDLFCIEKTCKLKEEIIKKKEAVCGNHICERNETKENCIEDCSICPVQPPLNCSGKVIFKGKDKNNCPLEPICIEEICKTDDECEFLCGKGKCEKENEETGKCKLVELGECKKPDCTDGDKKVEKCKTEEEIVIEVCIDGLWKKTGLKCEAPVEKVCEEYCKTVPHIMCVGTLNVSGTYPDCKCEWECSKKEEEIEKPIVGEECFVKEDCGGKDDVCSNGQCVTIPQVIQVPEERTELGEEKPAPVEEKEEEKVEEKKEHQQEPVTETPTEAPKAEAAAETSTETQATGNVIFSFFRALFGRIRGGITGAAITGFQTESGEGDAETPAESPGEQPAESPQPTETTTELPSERPGEQPAESPAEQPREEEQRERERKDWEEQNRREQETRDAEQKKRCDEECGRTCYNLIMPCVNKCIKEVCGEKLECNIDEKKNECEGKCMKEEDYENCKRECPEKCMKGGDWWKEYEGKWEEESHKEEKGVFKAGGMCRTAQQKTEGFIYFDGWGESFKNIQRLKQKYYSGGQADWCKQDLENLKKQRKEFENGFNQEFVTWFFEKYLANSAEDWEQQVSGIFELYWRDIDISRETAFRMKCLGINEFPEYNLINVKYETEYGKIEFWEEIKETDFFEIENLKVISPYMKIWIFPPKSFIKYEMKKAMKEHEFPGPSEDKANRKNEEGITAEEKEFIKQDRKFMKTIKKVTEKYNGNLNAAVQFKDYETNEIVFNLYVQINENDILKIEPMLPEEVPEKEVIIEVDFAKIYDMIYTMEKDMRGEETESPPWDKRARTVGQTVKGVVNGIKMYLKMRSVINSAKVTPDDSEKDLKALFKMFFSMMKEGEGKEDRGDIKEIEKLKEEEQGVWESKEKITGEVVG